ncbi:MAG: hypothetical protein SFV54_06735 [Bryobacteraceae bacterium]|nr:hypothetical protein [Bryobacteraceae bacterium]
MDQPASPIHDTNTPIPSQELGIRRRTVSLEDETARVTLTLEGGHIAEFLHKPSGINPLWQPPWPSIEPSAYHPARHPEYGGTVESRLLAGIRGHNLCLDVFGPPSPEEAAAGIDVHGESSVAPYQHEQTGDRELTLRATFPLAQLRFERRLRLLPGATLAIRETVENLTPLDRPLAWTHHVTLGPPFIEPGVTRLDMPVRRSMVFEPDLGPDGHYAPGAVFDWPHAPRRDGATTDLRLYPAAERSAGITSHLTDEAAQQAWFLAFHPGLQLVFGHSWTRADFPWIVIWEENRSRTAPPWNGRTITRGIEFGASPFPETRRAMITRGSLFGAPAYRWLPARASLSVEYYAFAYTAAHMPTAPPQIY